MLELFIVVFCCVSFDFVFTIVLVSLCCCLVCFVVSDCDFGYFNLVYGGCLINATLVALYCLVLVWVFVLFVLI